MTMLYVCVLSLVSLCSSAEILRPRGVSISNSVLYDPEKDFTCHDGSRTIPFHYVNDDYCDCHDGSDEPGTAACPNGVFHCTNAGHRPTNIPSSRVNDNICDCCDASDEYGSEAKCVNQCKEMGRAAREEAMRQTQLQQQGYEIRAELMTNGSQAREEMKVRLAELESRKAEASTLVEEKKQLKEEAEVPEKAALEVYRQQEEEERKRKEEEEEAARRLEAINAFQNLDSSEDGVLTIDEIQAHPKFDTNQDGSVSVEEAKTLLSGQEEMSRDTFLETGWMVIRPYYKRDDSGIYVPPPTPTDDQDTHSEQQVEEDGGVPEADADEESREEFEEEPEIDHNKEHYEEEYTYHDDTEDGDEDEEEETTTDDDDDDYQHIDEDQVDKETEDKYDEETKRLIEVASKARTEYEEADREMRDLDREINDLKYTLGKDWGKNNEFQPLEGQCFDYEDREYVYKLCPFDKATQKPKHGGTETKLGIWGNWDGPEHNKYEKMLYDKGVQCWNGPMRSALVILNCDIETRLTSVTEPNKCEYLFQFSTPAVCDKPEPPSQEHIHTEL